MERKKVVILQKRIKEYRVSLFDGIGELYDTTVVGYLDPLIQGDHYTTLKLNHKYWPISIDYYLDKDLRDLLRDADVVIRSTDFRSINNAILRKVAPKAKIIMYGIGVSASYNEHYDEVDESKQYLKMIKNSDAVIFYYDYPINKYVKQGADPHKLFAANNTVFVPEFQLNRKPENILFIGELYSQKGVDVLIEQYYRAYKKDESIPKLLLVGDGAERDKLEQLVADRGLSAKIEFLGKITDDNVLKGIFESSYICISPKQAGLSVLKSMAYGVPFVTIENAITGGEIFNIENGVTGLVLEDENKIKDVILDCATNGDYYNEMGIKAREFYFKNRTMKQMVGVFDKAIQYVLTH